MKVYNRIYWLLVLGFVFYALVLQVHAVWDFTVDDMYITLRYARHWASGDGLLWNLDALPVEGYSNFSFLVIAVLAIKSGIDPVMVLKLAGFAGLCGVVIGLYCLSRFWFLPRLAILSPLALLWYKGQIIWSVSGLETTVYEALIIGAVISAFKSLGYRFYSESRDFGSIVYFVLTAVFLTLAGMTRPEAPVLMMLLTLWMLWDRPAQSSAAYYKGMLTFSVTLLVCFGSYFLWRWFYFGWFFPNPVYCKGLYSDTIYQLDINYLSVLWPFILLALPALWTARDKRLAVLVTPSIIYLVLLLKADSIVAFDNRLFLASFALFLPVALLGLQKWMTAEGYDLVIGWVLVIWLFIPSMSLLQYRYFTQGPVEGERLRVAVARWLEAHVKTDERVVLADCGLIPYLTRHTFIDSYCLNNLNMAHDSESDRYRSFCHRTMKEKPEVIVLTALVESRRIIYTPSDRCLSQELKHAQDYTLQRTFKIQDEASAYQYEIYKKL